MWVRQFVGQRIELIHAHGRHAQCQRQATCRCDADSDSVEVSRASAHSNQGYVLPAFSGFTQNLGQERKQSFGMIELCVDLKMPQYDAVLEKRQKYECSGRVESDCGVRNPRRQV